MGDKLTTSVPANVTPQGIETRYLGSGGHGPTRVGFQLEWTCIYIFDLHIQNKGNEG